MLTFDRLATLKGKGNVCIKTAGGHFVGVVAELSTTEVVLHAFRHDAKVGDVLDEIAYIPLPEVRMIVHKLPKE